MKSIGIKLADGSFYPIMKDGSVEKKALDVTTVQDNQTKVQIDLYRSETDSQESFFITEFYKNCRKITRRDRRKKPETDKYSGRETLWEENRSEKTNLSI